MPVNWKEKAVSFDKLYSKNTWESKIPYLGNALRGSITDRMERAHAFAGSFKGKKCIDLGCGVGRFALQAAELGAITYGYDVSEDAIRIAKERAAAVGLSNQCSFFQADITQVDFPDADIWFDLGCLQYIPDISQVLHNLQHVTSFFSSLQYRWHWLNIPRFVYRRMYQGSTFYTYTESNIRTLFSDFKDVNIYRDSLMYYITS